MVRGSLGVRGASVAAAVLLLPALLAGCTAKRSASTTPAFEPVPPVNIDPNLGVHAPKFEQVPAGEIPTASPSQTTDAGKAKPYTISIGDKLEVSVYGDPDMTRVIPVRPDGKISFTFVGDVEAAGRTIEDLRNDLQTRLSSYLRNPEVTVIAMEFGGQKVYAGGELKNPGIFPITPGQNTVLDVVYEAGLPTDKADVSRAVLLRGGRLVPVDFEGLLHGNLSDNVEVRSNDVILFPENQDRYIYVLGEVGHPTTIETQTPRSMVNVLATAGGPDPSYAKVKEIAVLRGGLRNPKVAIVNYKSLIAGDLSQNIEVKPGDIVYVPTTGLGRYSRFIEQILRTFSLLFQARVVRQGL